MTTPCDDGPDLDLTAAAGGANTAWADCGDAALVAGIERGERGAFGEIYGRYGHQALLVAQAGCGVGPADGVVQDLFLRLWRAPSSYDPDVGSLRAFLVMGAHIGALRLAAEGQCLDVATGNRDLLSQLPPPARDAIALTLFGHFTYREAADALGRPADETRAHIRSGLRHLGQLRR